MAEDLGKRLLVEVEEVGVGEVSQHNRFHVIAIARSNGNFRYSVLYDCKIPHPPLPRRSVCRHCTASCRLQAKDTQFRARHQQ